MEHAGVIMAGGSGKRFWPVSRNNIAKQYLKLFGDKTLIQTAVERNAKVFGKNVFVCTNGQQKNTVHEQTGLNDTNFILEPFPRDTAAAIGLSALSIKEKFGADTVMNIVPADHLINNETAYVNNMKTAIRVAEEQDDIVVVGIPPTYPATALGYIEKGPRRSEGTWKVKMFREKPNERTARDFIDSGNFFWNAGMFVFKVDVMLNALKEHMPAHYQALEKIKESGFDSQAIETEFEKLEKISIDYGIIEKISNVSVVKAEFDWDDVGSWNALERIVPLDENKNAILGKFVGMDSGKNVVFSDSGMVACVGVNNLAVIKSGDAVLVCKKSDVENVKKLFQQLEENADTEQYT
jgi:mannose-1-phosphate guanylyltransferase